MGLKRQLERQKKAFPKNEWEKAYNAGFSAGVKQGFTSAEEYVNQKMLNLAEVRGVGNVLYLRILKHLGYEETKE